MVNILEVKDLQGKLQSIEEMVHHLLSGTFMGQVPLKPGRNIEIKAPHFQPSKKGYADLERRGRLMHDLASIELQAMELAIRTLVEFPEAPQQFREELAAVALSESYHLGLCIKELEKSGFKWGDWPAHIALWETVSADDNLLDRIFIVHRYLEGSGIDAGDTLLRRLTGMAEKPSEQKVLEIIHHDEIGHVEFGSRWYRKLCLEQKLDSDEKLKEQIARLRHILPKRIEKLAVGPRIKAGFTESEMIILEDLRQSFLVKNPGIHPSDQRSTMHPSVNPPA